MVGRNRNARENASVTLIIKIFWGQNRFMRIFRDSSRSSRRSERYLFLRRIHFFIANPNLIYKRISVDTPFNFVRRKSISNYVCRQIHLWKISNLSFYQRQYYMASFCKEMSCSKYNCLCISPDKNPQGGII